MQKVQMEDYEYNTGRKLYKTDQIKTTKKSIKNNDSPNRLKGEVGDNKLITTNTMLKKKK